MSSSASETTSSEKFTGRVKWFNNKAGYGFVTITDGSKSGSDVFIHHSAIKVDSEQYKYLVQGEYVEFGLITVEGGKHEYQASEVCGIKGGKLMCETRNELKGVRTSYKSVKVDVEDEPASSVIRQPRSVRPPSEPTRKPYRSQMPSARGPPRQGQGQGQRQTQGHSDGEWTYVKNKGPK